MIQIINKLSTQREIKFDVDIVDSGYIDYFYLRPNYII